MQDSSRPKTRKPQWVMAAAIGILAAGGGYLIGNASKLVISPELRGSLQALSGWDLLALPLVIVGVLAVHEAGHLVGGMSRGMRFLMFIAGPLGWFRGANGIHFRWMWNLGTFGGLAAATPVPDQPLGPQLNRLVIGGPLASLLLAAIGFAAMAWLPGRAGAYGMVVGVFSLLIFLVTAAPMRAGGFMSDGMQWLQLRRNPAMVDRRVRMMALIGAGMAGTRPRDYDLQQLAQAQAITGDEPLYDIGVWLCSYFHALDRGEVDQAGQWLDRIETVYAEYPMGFRQTLAIELALFEALHRSRRPEAEAWLAQSGGGIADAARRHLAEAAVAALRGEHASARGSLERAERSLGRSMDPGSAKVTVDQIAALRSTLRLQGA